MKILVVALAHHSSKVIFKTPLGGGVYQTIILVLNIAAVEYIQNANIFSSGVSTQIY